MRRYGASVRGLSGLGAGLVLAAWPVWAMADGGANPSGLALPAGAGALPPEVEAARQQAETAKKEAEASLKKAREEQEALQRQAEDQERQQRRGNVRAVPQGFGRFQVQVRQVEGGEERLREARERAEAMHKEFRERAEAAQKEAAERAKLFQARSRRGMLGVMTMPVPPAVRAHVTLPAGQGLSVEQVMPESIAAKAGLKQYDILLAADGKPMRSQTDLTEVVAQAEGKTIKLEVVREGKPRTIEVAIPAADANVPAGGGGLVLRAAPSIQFGEEGILIQQFGGGGFGGLKLPENCRVEVRQDKDGPAKIKVEFEGKTYETTADKLDDLPESLREPLRRMTVGNVLRMSVPQMRVEAIPAGGAFPPGAVPPMPLQPPRGGLVPAFPPQGDAAEIRKEVAALKKQLEELRRELNTDDLKEQLDSLRTILRDLNGPDKKPAKADKVKVAKPESDAKDEK